MPRKVGHVLSDILEAIECVESLIHDKTLNDFDSNWQLQWLVQRAIEVISEASRAIPAELKQMHPEIPWTSVRDIGNVLRHQYHGLSNALI